MTSKTTGPAFRSWPVLATGALLLVAASAVGQPLPSVDGREHLGVKSCSASTCHGSVVERNAYNVLQNEYQTWTKHDRHSRAYETLLSERSQRMARNLGLDKAHEAKVCLDCHADNVPAGRRGRFFNLSDGVGCEACHGGAEEWLGTHISGSSSQADDQRAGLYPTSDAGARAGLCLSCHLGTRDKFASHDIMGAGHPRLTFELYTFTRRQPAHYRVDADYRQRKGVTDPAAEWIEGVFVAATTGLELLDYHYEASGPFPELAFYDCHGCHHSMDKLRWQPAPEYGENTPGAVRLEDSRLKMVALLSGWSRGSGVDAELAALHRASRSGKGDLLAAAGRLRAAIGKTRAQVLRAAREPGAAASLRTYLASAAAAGRFNDYADIEQVAMAVQAIGGGDDLDAVFDSLLDADEYEPQVTAAEFARLPGVSAIPAPQRPPVVEEPAPVVRPPVSAEPVPAITSAPAITPVSDAVAYSLVNVPVLRVRAAPSASAAVVARLAQDTRVRIYETEGDWSRISFGPGTSGWTATRYLTPQ